ncbi:1-phosphofructokinase [Bombilactobacillus thymidiniphilus]|uniref:Tagatose-6-phosphate kinase n=1 Tax=Bombilactobacillus thymidiniphilus TaxID=2923363 RepID=A0ABY4PDI5_9LACO|nr:1-phosphofructokinase [Bombilactobacillus thymidiniphilus]UQS83738.1 1-phosphofructokinase [Bombilactobacillus thymidiniphilus]
MIYTVTANPSIDYVLQLTQLTLGEVNRVAEDVKLPGGKGINVSRILKELGLQSKALGFIGGATGQMFEHLLSKHQLQTDFTTVMADTRINVKIKASDEETEINGQGPTISATEKADFLQKIAQIGAGDVVVMAGSIPPQLVADFYLNIAKTVTQNGAEFVIDTTGQALLDTLPLHPLVIKPNHHELAELFQTEFNGITDIVSAARQLIEQGAQQALVSMAGDGALFVTKEHAYQCNAPKDIVRNSVGAGDSMIAGFVGTYMKQNDAVASFRMGAACGSATAFSEDLANLDKIKAVYEQINVTQIQ